jgi:transcription-repair coupling factor (superfamily II helicase)
MSLEGIRDFSVIATAPQKRLAIKTFVAPWSEGLIREAVMRELKRGGQAYFLHNEVDSIERMRERLERLLPEARIAVAHGQMRERELERVMRDFTAQRSSVLLCSTIIETGIDNPTTNTIVINRADRFGLAQLHQLRGPRRALAPPGLRLPPHARRRRAQQNAVKRLEGDPDHGGARLGVLPRDARPRDPRRGRDPRRKHQSGEMAGSRLLALRTRMLDRAVQKLKQAQAPPNWRVPSMLVST